MTYEVVQENWLTRKISDSAFLWTATISFLLFGLSAIYFENWNGATSWMPASREMVFSHHQIWRLWSALFAHGDGSHLLSNAFLFMPLTYFLTGHFGLWFFLIAGLFLGGAVNALTLLAMPEQTTLIGMSGVVYWMASAWLTLFLLLQTKLSLRRRFAHAVFLAMMLLVPETYRPEVSYLAHFYGFVLGALSGMALYALRREEFLSAEVREVIVDEESPAPHISGANPMTLVK